MVRTPRMHLFVLQSLVRRSMHTGEYRVLSAPRRSKQVSLEDVGGHGLLSRPDSAQGDTGSTQSRLVMTVRLELGPRRAGFKEEYGAEQLCLNLVSSAASLCRQRRVPYHSHGTV